LLKLHQIFFRNYTIVFSLLFVSIIAVVYFDIKDIKISASKNILENEIIANEKFAISHKYSEFVGNNRITIINSNGNVIFDNRKDISKMDNHTNRPEIIHSNTKIFGMSIRYSNSINKNMIYIAKKLLINNDYIYIRVSKQLDEIEAEVYNVIIKFAIVFVISILIGLIISVIINRNVKEETEKIFEYIKQIENKNYNANVSIEHIYEFQQIANFIRVLSKKLQKKEKIKNKYTAKIKLKNNQITKIIEAIGHEFKNPVAAIMGYTQTLLNEPNIEPKISQRFLQKINSNGKAISDMIDRISLSIKFENELIHPNFSQFTIAELVEDAIDIFNQKLKNRKIIFDKKDDYIVYADPTMIKIVIINLIDNAIKYSEMDIIVELYKKDNYVYLFVVDYGHGIEAEELSKITEKFYRINKFGWDNSLGLGLSLVSYTLKLHNETLIIDSELGKGSRFGFKLKAI
jgi:signal transduction histidine kinase